MTELRFTLVTDGSSDAILIHPLVWLLRANGVTRPLLPQWADLGRHRQRPRGLQERIRVSLEWYLCELLFVHRDAEREPRQQRVVEIQEALEDSPNPPAVCVVPVRMTEAWFLFDERAIRRAGGNPHGTVRLDLPELSRVQDEPDPKQVIREALLAASGLGRRRLRGFPLASRIRRLAELIDDFSPLRALSAFRLLEEELREVLRMQGWCAR